MRSISVRSFSILLAALVTGGLVFLGCDSQGPIGGEENPSEGVVTTTQHFSNSLSTINLNTGFNQSSSTLIGLGQDDDDWKVTDVPDDFTDDLPTTPFSAVVVDENPWTNYRGLNPLPDARWISVNEDGADQLVGGFVPGLNDFRFDYVREFTLPAPVARLGFKIKVDDKALEVRLNGDLIASDVGGGETVSTSDPAHFQSGTNQLKLEVQDNGGIVTGVAINGSVEVIVAEIDIKPGSDPNAINPNSGGVVPVAVLHTDDFDPATVDVGTVRFGDPEDVPGGGAEPAHNGHLEDVDNDGDDDLVLHFPTEAAGFEGDEEKGRLVGETNDGTPVFGTDSVKLVGGGPGGNPGNGNGPN